MVDVSDVKGLLRAFDGCMTAPVRNAVGMLRRVTEAIAKQPGKYELLDPDNCEEWRSAGGDSYCENVDFPGKVCSRWRELLGRPDWSRGHLDKEELEDLKEALTGFFKQLTDAEFELAEQEEMMAELEDAIAAAPEAEDEEEDSEDESD